MKYFFPGPVIARPILVADEESASGQVKACTHHRSALPISEQRRPWRGSVIMNQTFCKFRVGLTRDFLNERDELEFKDIGLSLLDTSPRILYEFLAERATVIRPKQVRDYDGVITFWPSYKRESFAVVERLLAIALFGVGYDHVDVEACTDSSVALFNAAGAVDRPVAEAILTLILSLSHLGHTARRPSHTLTKQTLEDLFVHRQERR